jgi:vitamin B12 transporter
MLDGGSAEGVLMNISKGHAGIAAGCLALFAFGNDASAQNVTQLPVTVVTADRSAEPITNTASAISVVGQETLNQTNQGSLVDALRSVPGLDITETGGPGRATSVRLRGANSGQTLVLIDGVRANDPTAPGADFDFSMFPAGTIERIEVLRGPQSALYGSDAIGGVINIITKKGGGPAVSNLRAEGGTYGTGALSGSTVGSQGPWSYALAGSGIHSDSFSAYGFRVPALEALFPHMEIDPYNRLSGSTRVGYDAGEGVRFSAGLLSNYTRANYDAGFGAFPTETPSFSTKQYSQADVNAAVDTFEGRWTHSITTFADRSDRSFHDVSYFKDTLPKDTTSTISDFIGDRVGAEYQGIFRAGTFGTLTYGAKEEQESARLYNTNLLPTFSPRMLTIAPRQETRSLFALYQLPLFERLNLSLGGRVDDVVGTNRFETWRATAAYLLPETGTKLRASAATGAKAPSLYQLYSIFGTPTLRPEQSFGYDGGIDQTLFGGRVTLSVTGFSNRLKNLIDFDTVSMHYFNVTRAATSGLEVESNVQLVPSYLDLRMAYTNLRARDLSTGLVLQRRPEHILNLALAFTPTHQWLIEPRVVLVSKRFSGNGETLPLAAYARTDLYTSYKIDKTWQVFARGENIFDTRYQEVFNYGTTGMAFYGGIDATW